MNLGAYLERSSAWWCHPAGGMAESCCCCRGAVLALPGSAQCWQAVLRQESPGCSVSAWGSNGHFCRKVYCPAPARLHCPLSVSWEKEKHWEAGQWKVATSSSSLARVKAGAAWGCASPNVTALSVQVLTGDTPVLTFLININMWVLPCKEIRSPPFHHLLYFSFWNGWRFVFLSGAVMLLWWRSWRVQLLSPWCCL